jgi:hypothetical protein
MTMFVFCIYILKARRMTRLFLQNTAFVILQNELFTLVFSMHHD